MSIDDIRKRAEAATPLPWCIGNIQNLDDCDKSNIIQCVYGDTIAYVPEPRYSSNADFIAHARQDVPYLLGLVDRMAAMLKYGAWKEADNGNSYCDYCGNRVERGHAPDCELNALLKEVGHE